MCLESNMAHKRLEHWAQWLHHEQGLLKELGYPSHSPEQSLPGGNQKIINHDARAEEVERFLCQMKKLKEINYQALMAYYFLGKNFTTAASMNNIARATFKQYFLEGLGWMEAKLY